MPHGATFDPFQRELARLVDIFGKNLAAYKSGGYDEASLRQEFLNPFFRALGWDIENKAGLILQHREVEIESRTQIGGRQKRADYLFRTHPTDRFVCEAKKPAEELHARYAFQAKRYAWNKGLALALLTDFEEMKIFIVGGKPFKDEPEVGLWKTWHFRQYPVVAQEIWNLLSRERVAAGSIDQLIESLPKRPTANRKAKQGWLIKPDRSRALDTDFLNFLDEARRELASDLLRHNDRADLLEGTRLNEAVQHILDRILFLRICEDRDIDTGRPLDRLVRSWRDDGDPGGAHRARQQPLELHEEPPAHYGGSGLRAPKGTLWHALVRHFRSLDRRPPSHIPFFNGNLFKHHFSEELVISDDWLAAFLDELGDEESPYLFNYIAVEILGTIYERFLGKIVRPQGRGVTIEEKPEVRKARGVYYTPRYVVEYIVGQTVGKLLARRKPEDALKLRILDPACGSGSFLIRAFEQVCEHCQQWLTDHADQRKKDWCWLDEKENALHLTTKAKRRILRETIHGVDLDPQAVEVTQLSLYLKMLESENRATLARERDLFANEEALLPPLENNIKCGNSLIAQDFSMMPDDLVRVRALDWPVQFAPIMKAGGFDAVIGNPPYIQLSMEEFRDDQVNSYLKESFGMSGGRLNTFILFIEKARCLTRIGGEFGFIVPNTLLTQDYYQEARQRLVQNTWIQFLVSPQEQVFTDAVVENIILIAQPTTARAKNAQFESLFANLSELGLDSVQTVRQNDFATNFRTSFIVPADPALAALKTKLNSQRLKFGTLLNINQAIALKHDRAACLTDKPTSPKHHEILDGRHIGRYFTGDSPNYFKFDIAKIHSCKREDIFLAPQKILMRRVGDSLIGTLDEKQKFALNTLVVMTPLEKCGYALKFILGLFNSRLMNFFYTRFLKSTKKVFSEIQARQVAQLPVPELDLTKSADKARHDKLMGLVDKMLALTPKLRAAKTDAERETLQNAVTATDQHIDALVYELYGLTEDEIKLVAPRERQVRTGAIPKVEGRPGGEASWSVHPSISSGHSPSSSKKQLSSPECNKSVLHPYDRRYQGRLQFLLPET
jgi:type I restriction-modification system DNA methylase subunit